MFSSHALPWITIISHLQNIVPKAKVTITDFLSTQAILFDVGEVTFLRDA
jgi:hypothetical protein